MKKLLTMSEAAEIIGVRDQKLYIMAREGMFPVVHVGRLLKVDPDRLQEWIENGGQGGWKKEA